MLEPEAVQAALLAAAGEVQTLTNQLGLAARSGGAAKFVFDTDMRASLRRALQFGRAELVAERTVLSPDGILAGPTDVVVAGRTRTPQLAIELAWHPRGEDHAAFASSAIGAIVKMAVAKSRGAVEQGTVLVGAPSRFWRWLPAYAEERVGYELVATSAETPASVKSEFLAGPGWDFLFESGLTSELPDRLWTSLVAATEIRSPWGETELRLLEAKGLGRMTDVRS